MNNNGQDNETATLASGCFWCNEAVFKRIKGVKSVVPGYSGGTTENPSYDEICVGNTGHAESPTTPNRQGNDVGTQYRSAIFFHYQKQKETAEKLKTELYKERLYTNPIITEISPLKDFYDAEEYHRNYYEDHKDIPYCNIVISPKITSLLRKYGHDLKE
jgi:peptide-methionine (S)-S-oxide reductase